MTLGISEKMVQAHLYGAFRKCGILSRTQMSRRVLAG
jgi:DNA-binding CsgD family transcriptional regulator